MSGKPSNLTQKYHKNCNISLSSDYKKMKRSSLESSHRGGSNGNRIAFLTLIDDKLGVLKRTCDISPSSDCKRINNSSLESPHRGGSFGSKFAFLPSLDSEILKLINILFQ